MASMGSPVQKGPVGLLDYVFLSLANLVPLLCVGNSQGFLDLAQFFKAIIEALATKKVEREVAQRHTFGSVSLQQQQQPTVEGTGSQLTLNRSLIICRSLSRSWGPRKLSSERSRLPLLLPSPLSCCSDGHRHPLLSHPRGLVHFLPEP